VVTSTDAVVETHELTKRYGRITAVDSVSLTVNAGDRYGFLGPNGSGKTTTIRMLLGLVFPTSGSAFLLGQPLPQQLSRVLPQVGALVEGPAAYPHLSGRANLSLSDAAGPGGARRTRKARIDEALDAVGLGSVDSRPVKAYSLGMRQRLGLAAALLRRPQLLILDEPTNGLDPQGIVEIRTLLEELNARGTTLLVSSHLLSEVELLCTRVGVLDRGRLVVEQDLDDLRAPTGLAVVTTAEPAAARRLLGGRVVSLDGSTLTVTTTDTAALNRELVAAGVGVIAIAPQVRTLEQVVLALTHHGSDRVAAPTREDIEVLE
jgi:ABC-2 type transport system ATP-binding protein